MRLRCAWNPSAGASSYVVARSTDGRNWSAIATTSAASYADPSLPYATTYQYCVFAVSSAGTSPASAVVTVQTLAPPDLLSAHALVLTLTKNVSFTGSVATFTDLDAATGAASFVATINWGKGKTTAGTVEGSGGTFTVTGTHKYLSAGVFRVNVTVTMTTPGKAATSVKTTAEVSNRPKRRPQPRPARRAVTRTHLPPTSRKHGVPRRT